MFHRNSMNTSYLSYHARHLRKLGLKVLLVSYRGFGEPEGVPSKKGESQPDFFRSERVLMD